VIVCCGKIPLPKALDLLHTSLHFTSLLPKALVDELLTPTSHSSTSLSTPYLISLVLLCFFMFVIIKLPYTLIKALVGGAELYAHGDHHSRECVELKSRERETCLLAPPDFGMMMEMKECML
jgi:hypothetical protein